MDDDIQKVLCWLGFHAWSKWSEMGNITRPNFGPPGGSKQDDVVGKLQERQCQACCFKQYHKQHLIGRGY